MTERDRMLMELKAAADVRDRCRQSAREAELRVLEAKADLRNTREYKILLNAKAALVTRERHLADAIASHDQVELELLTGLTGLDLFDAPKKAKKAATTTTAPAEAVAS